MRAFILVIALVGCSKPAQEAEAPHAAAPTQTAAPPSPAAQAPQEALAAMPSWQGARAAGVGFRAVGQEPGWLLDIYSRGLIKFAWDYGENYAEFAVAEPSAPQEGVTRYEGHSNGRALAVTIRRSPCNDGMSGEAYPSTVEVVIDGRTLTGCGRDL